MANVHYFGPKTDATEARSRQEIVDDLKSMLDGLGNLKAFPGNFKLALRDKIWAQKRQLAGGTMVDPISFDAFIKTPYPVGLGVDYATIAKLIADDTVAKNAFDQELAREPGNPTGANQHTKTEDIGTLYNVQESCPPEAPTGNTEAAGLRRLRKAAEAGDTRAQMWLDDVLADKVSVHRACIEMGWRKPTVTLRDEPVALFEAAVKKSTPFETAKRAWFKMSQDDQECFLDWASQNMTTVMKSFA